MNAKSRIRLLPAILALSLIAPLAQAQKPWREATKGYWKKLPNARTLPPMCGVSNNPKYRNINWKKLYGPDYTWINHYCEAKTKLPICYRYSGGERNDCLKTMAEGIAYSINHAKNPNYKLLPLLHTDYGVIQSDLGNYASAAEHFETSIKKNRRYIPAYAHYADLLVRMKRYGEARKILQQGLKAKNSKLLRKKLKKLKGRGK